LNIDVEAWVVEAMRNVPLREALITHEVALETRRVNLPHRDPADRFLAATARVFGLTLVTADERIIDAKARKLRRYSPTARSLAGICHGTLSRQARR